MTAKYPEEFAGPGEAAKKTWYEERLAEAEAAKDFFATAFHLRQLLRLEPANAEWKTKLSEAEDRLKVREPAPPPKEK